MSALTGEGQAACAGMEAPLLVRAGGAIEEIAVSGALLGLENDQEYPSAPFHLGHGDALLTTTDGITEARRGPEFLGGEGLRRLVEGAAHLDTLDLRAQAILARARAFGGGKFRDDVCLVFARRS